MDIKNSTIEQQIGYIAANMNVLLEDVSELKKSQEKNNTALHEKEIKIIELLNKISNIAKQLLEIKENSLESCKHDCMLKDKIKNENIFQKVEILFNKYVASKSWYHTLYDRLLTLFFAVILNIIIIFVLKK